MNSEEVAVKGQLSYADEQNVWASLDAPLCDFFLSIIVPSYLTADDLSSLSAVSRRYRDLFCSKSLMSSVLKRDATHNPSARKYFCCVDQLPTFGNHRTPDKALLDEPRIVMLLPAPFSSMRRFPACGFSSSLSFGERNQLRHSSPSSTRPGV